MVNESLNHIRQTIILIKYYSFDLHSYKIIELIIKWTKIYPHHWLPLGVTEAIYQGRLKAISVEQILNIWLKKGEVNQSFNYEFSCLIKPDAFFSYQEDQELKYFFTNVNSQQNFDIFTVNKKSEELLKDRVINMDKIDKSSIEEHESSLNNFKPLEDYSQCFQKLKGFIAIKN
ncbi:hypothetical protein [Geminocystis sp. NIES-3709]|uniref:hypothetical protein n=1 Tax=Geminocystis sp. NIES-3709 TaxID=1617448 RepID=UPI0005FCBED7|nr:hypothetical protein [Geminocystis sp. NIES-3709]BAQ63652.1 hypothetical protein GM3709_417 [Geminocystis sp. NIES-3709]